MHVQTSVAHRPAGKGKQSDITAKASKSTNNGTAAGKPRKRQATLKAVRPLKPPKRRRVKAFSTRKQDKYMRVLTDEDWETLADLRTLLAPLADVQKLMQGEKYITLSEVPFHAHTLRKHLTAMADDPSIRIKDTARLMLEDFNARWPSNWPRAVMIAVALDPRTKMMKCFTKEQKVSLQMTFLCCMGVGMVTQQAQQLSILIACRRKLGSTFAAKWLLCTCASSSRSRLRHHQARLLRARVRRPLRLQHHLSSTCSWMKMMMMTTSSVALDQQQAQWAVNR